MRPDSVACFLLKKGLCRGPQSPDLRRLSLCVAGPVSSSLSLPDLFPSPPFSPPPPPVPPSLSLDLQTC